MINRIQDTMTIPAQFDAKQLKINGTTTGWKTIIFTQSQIIEHLTPL